MSSDLLVVVTAHLDMVVDLRIQLFRVVVLEPESVLCPGVEVRPVLKRVGRAVDIVVSGHDAHSHVVQTPLRHSAVQDSNRQVAAPVGGARVEDRISRHAHVQTSKR